MNKKSTLLTAVLMAVTSFSIHAVEVASAEWTSGKYYYLKSGDSEYLSLYGLKADSLVFKTLRESAPKAAIDSALWEITKVGTETGGDPIYQFKNKKTKAVLSFEKSEAAKPVLVDGVAQWSFKNGKISAHWSDKSMVLSKGTNGITFKGGSESVFTVEAPNSAYTLKAAELGENFSVFQLSFGGEFSGDIFSGKDLLARPVESANGWVTLQKKGEEAFNNGIPKYFGLDTVKSKIEPTSGVFGASFALDSTYIQRTGVHTVGNATFQQFKFLVDLKNDSLAMFVKQAPVVDGTGLRVYEGDVRVVYTKVETVQLLTVSEKKSENDNSPKNGIAPFITVKKGTPAEITKGTGVYFLKSASKTSTGGKYIAGYDKSEKKIQVMTETPSVNNIEGQWYIKEEGGLYSIVSRGKTSSDLLLKGEVFAVQGMQNTYTFGGNADSITVEYQNVDINNKYLGSLHFTKEKLANNGYVLNLIPAGLETSNAYAFTSDSLLKIVSGEAKDAVIFKLDSVKETEIGGARALNDVVSIITYQLKSQFSDKYVAYDEVKKCLKITTKKSDALNFHFHMSRNGSAFDMQNVSTGKYITADSYSSNMIYAETPAYFKFVEMDAPEYGTFESGHKRFSSELKSLTMNPLNFFAEAKQEGQEILKQSYEKDNFSLRMTRSEASTADRPLYFISTSLEVDGLSGGNRIRYYMVSGRDSSLVDTAGNNRVHFIANDTIETMKESAKNPALWALKVTESGNYLLESQQEVNNIALSANVKTPYIGIVNNVVVMSGRGAEFSVEAALPPVANEEIEMPVTVKVIGGVGEFNIRNASGKRITLSNILGQRIGSRVLSSDSVTVPTARGVVIVSVEGDRAYKVIVK